ncbi:hypothetical protein Ciccas_011848 [Cichlidogyrus casuarinus]|uniref:Uncharacterized protein n=1 Tax=Cichlidogyrus casuarinus TaxID=1844966 RepID=A0ABD2PQK0_9PLAT
MADNARNPDSDDTNNFKNKCTELEEAKKQISRRLTELSKRTSLLRRRAHGNLETSYHQMIRSVIKLNKCSSVDAWMSFQEIADNLAKMHRIVGNNLEKLQSSGYQDGYHTLNREFINHVDTHAYSGEDPNSILLLDDVRSFFDDSTPVNIPFPRAKRRFSFKPDQKRHYDSSTTDEEAYSKRPRYHFESSDEDDFEEYDCESSDESSAGSHLLEESADFKSTLE